MIGKRLRRQLTRQIAAELAEQQACLGISLYFERQSLVKWARLFRERSIEESAHAVRAMTLLAAGQVAFDLPEVAGARTEFKSPTRAIRAALDGQRRVLARLDGLARAAAARGDGETLLVVQWLVARHVEGEREMRRLADLVASGVNLFQAEALLDQCDQPSAYGTATGSSGDSAS